MKTLLILSLLVASLTAHALPRTSAAYTLSPETTNAGGSRTASASYSHEGSLGEIGGFSSAASPSVTVLGGYIGALDVVGLVPDVTTSPVTDLTETGATLSGELTAEGGSAVTERGFVLRSSPNPTVEDNTIQVFAGPGTGTFTAPVSLSPGTTYHLRAYATSEIGTGYGDNVVFTTPASASFTDGIATFARDILAGDRQIFHFSLGGPRVVSFAATGGAFLRAELFDGEGNLITSFDGDSDFDLEQLLLAGDYAFHVYRQAGGGGAESFVLEIDASVVAASRPDVAVGNSPARMVGRGVYAGRQQSSLVSKKARPVTGHVRVGNRGNLPDVLKVRGTPGNGFFSVAYFAPRNVTAAMRTGAHRTPTLVDGAEAAIRVAVKPNKRKLTRKKGRRTTILRKSRILTLVASSTFDPAQKDAASLKVLTK